MIFRPVIVLLLASFLAFACGQKSSHTSEKLLATIARLEASLKNEVHPDSVTAITGLYEQFITAFPKDTLHTPVYIFKTANNYLLLRQFDQAVVWYDRFLKDFPAHAKAPQSLFLKAYTYENDLGDLEKARAAYEEFLQKFPGDEMADDAQFSLSNLGKSPEEILNLIRSENPDSLDR